MVRISAPFYTFYGHRHSCCYTSHADRQFTSAVLPGELSGGREISSVYGFEMMENRYCQKCKKEGDITTNVTVIEKELYQHPYTYEVELCDECASKMRKEYQLR